MSATTPSPSTLPTPSARLSLTEVEAVARAAHAGQTDKAGRPYAEHLRAVAEGVRRRGGDDEQIAAAWLHDAVEDDALSEDWLREAPLSRRTKDIVLALTKRPGEPPEAYAARILATPGAPLVKEADLAHNADPARLAVLDGPTRTRLTEKYARMRALLGQADGNARTGRTGQSGQSGQSGRTDLTD
ncbi:HD domain-containing protein [Streptomyces sp. IPPR8]|uniref:HD domain-containing protein n=1 Tax=Streptomyces sp. IPPR8 TaxID=3417301 RepID=UPI003D683237